MHKLVQKFADIKVGSRVKVRFWQPVGRVMERDSHGICVETVNNGVTYVRQAGPNDYEYTVGVSTDCENQCKIMSGGMAHDFARVFSVNQITGKQLNEILKLMQHLWTTCEQYYGISLAGSADTEVFRQIALAALKGDNMALDIINDGLGDRRYEKSK